MKHPKSYDTTPETSKRMSRVHLKQGKAEVLLAKRLWHLGFRYRLNDKRLPGSPDIAVLRYNIAIFVDGEFWHGQNWEERKSKLKRNREYWIAKIEGEYRTGYSKRQGFKGEGLVCYPLLGEGSVERYGGMHQFDSGTG